MLSQPEFPIYIPSKGRFESRITIKTLDKIGVDYKVIVEEQEYAAYAAEVDKSKLLVLDKAYQRDYETFDALGLTKSVGPGPARNFAWDHSIAAGYPWHWVMDDNIMLFFRMNRNRRIPVADGTIFRCMEDFALRYKNVAMVGPQYRMFAPNRSALPPYVLATRIYSCNLIRNDVPFRWRGRYNEDTDLSLCMLKAGWLTVQFNAFLQDKLTTQKLKGGNTAEFYAKEGTLPKSQMLVSMHPDVARLAWRFGRAHHYVNYKPFKHLQLIRKPDVEVIDCIDNYGMELIQLETPARK